MELSYEMTRDDWREFSSLEMHLGPLLQKLVRRHRRNFILVYGFIGAILVGWLVYRGANAVGFILTLGFFTLFTAWAFPRKKQAKEGASRFYRQMVEHGDIEVPVGRFHVRVGESGLESNSADGEARHGWSSIKSVRRVRGFVAIDLPSSMVLVIPKRAFNSKEAVDEFVAMVEERIQSAKELASDSSSRIVNGEETRSGH